MNKVIIMGNVGSNPESKFTSTGKQVTRLQIATHRKWTGQDGAPREEVSWHRIIFWEGLAKVVNDHVTKGRKLLVEGHLQYSTSEREDGSKVYYTEIVADSMEFADSPPQRAKGGPEDRAAAAKGSRR